MPGELYHRPMMKCASCRRWWSGEPINGNVQLCACGGELKVVDMQAHLASIPYLPFDHTKK